MLSAGANEWGRGWPIVLSSTIGMALASLHTSVSGVLMQPLASDFGWSRAQVSIGIMILCVVVLLLGPVVGAVVDRTGPRKVALAGIVLYGLAFANLGLVGPGIVTWYLAWLFLGLAYPLVCGVVWTMAIGRCFSAHRGIAFSIALSGSGLASILTPLVVVTALPVIGWRAGIILLAAVAAPIAFVVVWYFFRPDAVTSGDREGMARASPVHPGLEFHEIVTGARFWALCACVILFAAGIGSLYTHFIPLMRDAGLSAGESAGYFSLVGITVATSRFAVGFLLDRVPVRFVAAVCFIFPAVSCAMLIGYSGTSTQSIILAVLVGLSYGAETDIIAYIAAAYFGLRRYGFVYATFLGLYSFVFGLSPVISGFVFDTTGSYAHVFQPLVVLLGLGALIVVSLGRAPDFVMTSRPADDLASPG